MAHIVVDFEGSGHFVERDAWWYRLRVYRDGTCLGCWNGTMNGLESIKLDGRIPPDALAGAAVVVAAERLRQLAATGALRSHWSVDVGELPISATDLLRAHQIKPPDEFEPGETVVAFDLDGRRGRPAGVPWCPSSSGTPGPADDGRRASASSGNWRQAELEDDQT